VVHLPFREHGKRLRLELFGRLRSDGDAHHRGRQMDEQPAHSGVIHLQNGNFHQAEAELRRALVMQPENAALRGYLSSALYHLGKLEEARREVLRAISLAPVDDAFRYTYGLILEELQRLDEAAEEYGVAASLNIGDTRYHLALAALARKRGDLHAAEGFVKKALTQDERHPQALRELARLRRQRGDISGAMKTMRSLLARQGQQKDSWQDHFLLGELLEEAGDLKGAEAELEMAMVGDSQVLFALGRVLLKQGQKADVLRLYEWMKQQNPNYRSAYERDIKLLLAQFDSGQSAGEAARSSLTNKASRTVLSAPTQTSSTAPPSQPAGELPASPPASQLDPPQPAAPAQSAAQDAEPLATPPPSAKPVATSRPATTTPPELTRSRPAKPEIAAAIAQLEAAIATDPHNSRLHRELSILYLRAGRLAEAKEHGRLAEQYRAQRFLGSS